VHQEVRLVAKEHEGKECLKHCKKWRAELLPEGLKA